MLSLQDILAEAKQSRNHKYKTTYDLIIKHHPGLLDGLRQAGQRYRNRGVGTLEFLEEQIAISEDEQLTKSVNNYDN